MNLFLTHKIFPFNTLSYQSRLSQPIFNDYCNLENSVATAPNSMAPTEFGFGIQIFVKLKSFDFFEDEVWVNCYNLIYIYLVRLMELPETVVF